MYSCVCEGWGSLGRVGEGWEGLGRVGEGMHTLTSTYNYDIAKS